jgi:spermidine dehydrogenase
MPDLETTSAYKRLLGLDRPIDRRDFFNGLAVSALASWGATVAPRDVFAKSRLWRKRKHWGGNDADAYDVGHALRDGAFDNRDLAAHDTGELYDVVIVGGGLSGLAAAASIDRLGGRNLKVLILENHAVPGGAAKMDVFKVANQRLFAAQGSIVSQVPTPGLAASEEAMDLLRDALPVAETYKVPHMDRGFSIVRRDSQSGRLSLYQSILEAPIPEDVKAGYFTFLQEAAGLYANDEWSDALASLDGQSFKDYIASRGWPASVYDWMVPELATFFGLPDQVSAAAVWRQYGGGPPQIRSFPGGNAVFATALIRTLWPDVIKGEHVVGKTLDDIIDIQELDQASRNPALRLHSTAVHVQHMGKPESAERVAVTYTRRGKLERVQARTVIMAGGAFVTQYVVRDLPEDKAAGMRRFIYAPIVWANVALNNAEALDKADPAFLTMLSETRGSLMVTYDKMNEAGWSSMRNSSRPTVLGLSIPYFYPGEASQTQASRGRQEILETPFDVYEKWIRDDLLSVLGPYSFDPSRDIEAISVSRWGHGYVFPNPGFLTDGARQKAAELYGRIAYAHTDLDGFSHITGAVGQGYRAAQEVVKLL